MSSQFPPDSTQHDHRGEIVGERYRLIELLDRGGQATVYRALDLRMGDEVAVKAIAPPKRADAAWRDRMLREVHALTVLSGTAAVRVYHQVWGDDGTLFLIMELLRGGNFESYLDVARERGQLLGLAELRPLVGPLVSTLEIAHHLRIPHISIDGSAGN